MIEIIIIVCSIAMAIAAIGGTIAWLRMVRLDAVCRFRIKVIEEQPELIDRLPHVSDMMNRWWVPLRKKYWIKEE